MLQKKYPELQIIGIHTPEFDWEKDHQRMRREMEKYRVTYPQVLDDDFKYWKALGNRYWPSFYLVDKKEKSVEVLQVKHIRVILKQNKLKQ